MKGESGIRIFGELLAFGGMQIRIKHKPAFVVVFKQNHPRVRPAAFLAVSPCLATRSLIFIVIPERRAQLD